MNDQKFSPEEKTRLLSNSIERVINNAIWVGEKGMTSKNSHISERSGILVEDLEELKSLMCKLWAEAQETARQ